MHREWIQEKHTYTNGGQGNLAHGRNGNQDIVKAPIRPARVATVKAQCDKQQHKREEHGTEGDRQRVDRVGIEGIRRHGLGRSHSLSSASILFFFGRCPRKEFLMRRRGRRLVLRATLEGQGWPHYPEAGRESRSVLWKRRRHTKVPPSLAQRLNIEVVLFRDGGTILNPIRAYAALCSLLAPP
jgi:hypothetical protein